MYKHCNCTLRVCHDLNQSRSQCAEKKKQILISKIRKRGTNFYYFIIFIFLRVVKYFYL